MKLVIRLATKKATKTYEDLDIAYKALQNARNELILALQILQSDSIKALVDQLESEISNFEKDHFVQIRS
jgi:ethanolamine utilization protein EutP (predicted NTPase)